MHTCMVGALRVEPLIVRKARVNQRAVRTAQVWNPRLAKVSLRERAQSRFEPIAVRSVGETVVEVPVTLVTPKAQQRVFVRDATV